VRVCVRVCVRVGVYVRRISPPSVDELQTRLCARATEDEAGVQRRLVLAQSGTVQWCVCVCMCMYVYIYGCECVPCGCVVHDGIRVLMYMCTYM
jgi:hypothetical protein